jgi:DNA-binding transcriptional LysR family regulator
MDNLAGVSAFVQAAEALSFVEAGRLLGVSASAIGKSVARLEARLGWRRLFVDIPKLNLNWTFPTVVLR